MRLTIPIRNQTLSIISKKKDIAHTVSLNFPIMGIVYNVERHKDKL